MSRGDIAELFILMVGGGLYYYWKGLNQTSLKNAIKYLATSKAVSVAPGLTEVSGIARRHKQDSVSPYGQRKCLYYSTTLYKWSGSGKHRHRTLVKNISSKDSIYLEDETGSVLIKPTLTPIGPKTDVGLKEDRKASKAIGKTLFSSLLSPSNEKKDTKEPMYRFVRDFAPELINYDDTLEVHETFIEDGDPIYLLGTAKAFDDKASEMVVWDDPKGKYYCISDGKEEDELRRVSYYAGLYSYGGPLLFLAGYILLLMRFHISDASATAFGILVALLMYSWIAATTVVAMYNGLIQLKNNILRAGANIDVLLKKRYTLIPELADITGSFAQYEKALQTQMAALRGLPVGQAGKTLLAAIENYPDLKANEGFMNLQRQISLVENQIAASRTYYNDSVKIYNSQIESFPYLFFAPKMGMNRMDFLKFKS